MLKTTTATRRRTHVIEGTDTFAIILESVSQSQSVFFFASRAHPLQSRARKEFVTYLKNPKNVIIRVNVNT